MIPHAVVNVIKRSSARDVASVYCAFLKSKPGTLKRPLQSLTNICTMKARPNFSHLWSNWGALHTVVRDSDSTSHCAGERLLGFLTAGLRDIPPLLKLSNSEKKTFSLLPTSLLLKHTSVIKYTISVMTYRFLRPFPTLRILRINQVI